MKVHRPVRLERAPRVTVVIPHFNYGQYLPIAVASVLQQKDVDVDIIIVDDKSTDGSEQVARRIAATDDRIALVEHETNMRHIRTYNDGLGRATGEYVVLLSADDALAPDSLRRSIALMEAFPDVGMTYGRVTWFDEELPDAQGSGEWWQTWSGPEWIARMASRGRNAVVNPEVVMRKAVYDQIGGYDVDFPHAGDMYMWLQAAGLSDIGFVGGKSQAYYRDHGANMHSTDFGGALDDMRQVRDTFERFFRVDGAHLHGVQKLRNAANRALAREALLRGTLLVVNDPEHAEMEIFSAFAQETDPAIVGSPVWRWARQAASSRSGLSRSFIRTFEDQRWRVRSRRAALVGF